MKLYELPDEIITEISKYFSKQKEVYSFMLINKEIYEFMIDADGRIFNNYGYCCINVRFVIMDKNSLKNIRKHYVKRLYVGYKCKISNEDVKKYLLDVYNLEIYELMFINNERMKCFENCNINTLRIFIHDVYDNDLVYLKNIECLDISCRSNNNITNEGLKYLSNLKKLILNDSENDTITDFGLRYLENIHTLKIENFYKITGEGIKYLKNIHELDINKNRNMIDQYLDYLPKTIYDLNISYCKNITNIGLKYLSSTSIHKLSIVYNQNITDKGLEYLPKTICDLNISYCKNITDVGLKWLSMHTSMHALDVSGNTNITDASLENLPKTIHTLHIMECKKITNSGVKFMSKNHTQLDNIEYHISDQSNTFACCIIH